MRRILDTDRNGWATPLIGAVWIESKHQDGMEAD